MWTCSFRQSLTACELVESYGTLERSADVFPGSHKENNHHSKHYNEDDHHEHEVRNVSFCLHQDLPVKPYQRPAKVLDGLPSCVRASLGFVCQEQYQQKHDERDYERHKKPNNLRIPFITHVNTHRHQGTRTSKR